MHVAPQESTAPVLSPESPRRAALRALVASGLALVGLGHAFDDSDARKKTRAAGKKKKNKTRPGPDTLTAVLGSDAGCSVETPGGTCVGGSHVSGCPAGYVAVSYTMLISNPLCSVFDFGPLLDFSGYTLDIKCPAGETSIINDWNAVCLKVT
jgi:hypothetical protein